MQVTVDSPRPSQMKNGCKSLSFTVVLADGADMQAIAGFRLMDGYIHPPMVFRKTQRQWVPLFACSRDISNQIHAAIDRKNWPVVYDLPSLVQVPEAIKKLDLTPEIAGRMAPNTLTPVDN